MKAHFALFIIGICLFHLTYGNQQDINQQLLAKIEQLEQQGKEQTAHIGQLEHQLEEQSQHTKSELTEIEELRDLISKQNLLIKQIQAQNLVIPQGVLNGKMNLLNAEFSKLDTEKLLYTRHSILETGKFRQNRLVLDSSESIAFYAHIDKPSLDNIAVNQTVVFETVDTNLGSGYNKQTGVFTAPRPGIYLLSTSFGSYTGHQHEIHLAMNVNGKVLAKAVAHGDSGHRDQGSTTVLTPLNKGDRVWLTNVGDPASSVGGGVYSNFMGIALFEM